MLLVAGGAAVCIENPCLTLVSLTLLVCPCIPDPLHRGRQRQRQGQGGRLLLHYWVWQALPESAAPPHGFLWPGRLHLHHRALRLYRLRGARRCVVVTAVVSLTKRDVWTCVLAHLLTPMSGLPSFHHRRAGPERRVSGRLRELQAGGGRHRLQCRVPIGGAFEFGGHCMAHG